MTATNLFLFLCLFFWGCRSSNKPSEQGDSDKTLFSLLSPAETHVTFENTLTEGLNTNVLLYQYFYNGGGVAIGDLNGDGLADIYFTGNMTDNKLYLNKGRMQFADVTDIAGVSGRPGPWKTGVTLVDINGDGKLDIFVCYSGHLRPDKRVNQLFINQGNDNNGNPVFAEKAADYGLNFSSYSTQAYFFDYDRDGDLDLLLVNHNPERLDLAGENAIGELMKKNDNEAGIRLLRNDNDLFHDITSQSGIVNTTLSYGLAAGIADVDGDGWPDIYISNDYNVPDRLYINLKNGTFKDEISRQTGHTSFYSMGNDIADINNDGKPDIYTLDMLPEDNRRQKLLFGADNYESFNLNLRSGFYYQYMRNMLHINNGDNTFCEIGQLAGVSNTDWSWAPLFADYDNDGWKDLFVSNGYTKDYTNMDFLKFASNKLQDKRVVRQDLLDLVAQMPSSDVESYFFRNNGNLTFANSSKQWGITQPANSNGAAYGDLDNDGYLDMVVNNINKPAFVYHNQGYGLTGNHYLNISLAGADKNTQGIGAKLILYTDGKRQYLEQMPTRGYQSSVSPVLHFGLGKDKKVDSLRIIWQRGKTQLLYNLQADQKITLNEKNASDGLLAKTGIKPLFIAMPSPVSYQEKANAANDYKRQPLLVNPMSFSGPCMIKGDVNGDGLEDVYVNGQLYIQQKSGRFLLKPEPAFDRDRKSTDAAAVFFDANNDGKPDLYVCSGGYDQYASNDSLLQDRLYINDGKGNFTKAVNALPKMLSSKGCVKSADINGDGYPDLFVGGRVIPGNYPETPESFILINDGKGHFSDQTDQYNAALRHIGMVTDAAWVDMNGDKLPDLVIVGEWMPISVFENKNGRLTDRTSHYFDHPYTGWWNCLLVTDINHDGKADLIAGNLGLNSQCKASLDEPAELYYKDFDNNGFIDPILCFYIQHKSYPFVTRDELMGQTTMMRTRFPDYKSWASATIEQMFTPEEMKGAKHLAATTFSTSCFISDSMGRFHLVPLPLQAQYAPVFTITKLDYDQDGKDDLLLCGNMNHARIRFGKYDANYGVLLKGEGDGKFAYVPQQLSGFSINGDVRSILAVNNFLLLGINGVGVTAYKKEP